jgi:hypothetical protein
MLQELSLTRGELAIVVFVLAAVLSARFWPRLGERIADRFWGPRDR